MTDWSPNDPDAVNVYYDLAAWTPDQQAELTEALAEAGIPHGWEGTELVVPEELEVEVDALFEVLEAKLGIDSAAGPVTPAAELRGGEPLTEYELEGWSVADRQILTESLIAARIPHRWEDATLLVPTPAEEAVDELLDEVEGGEIVTMPTGDVEAATGAEVLDAFFTAGDRLARDPLDADGLEALLRALDAADPAAPPPGVMLGAWRDACGLADLLADALAGSERPDELAAIALAERLRDTIRPSV